MLNSHVRSHYLMFNTHAANVSTQGIYTKPPSNVPTNISITIAQIKQWHCDILLIVGKPGLHGVLVFPLYVYLVTYIRTTRIWIQTCRKQNVRYARFGLDLSELFISSCGCDFFFTNKKNKNIERHTAHAIVSWPNPEQWVIIHTNMD